MGRVVKIKSRDEDTPVEIVVPEYAHMTVWWRDPDGFDELIYPDPREDHANEVHG